MRFKLTLIVKNVKKNACDSFRVETVIVGLAAVGAGGRGFVCFAMGGNRVQGKHQTFAIE